MRPPTRVHLPSGRIVGLQARELAEPRRRQPREPMFSELGALVASGDLVLREDGASLDLGTLALCDFHALRAIVIRTGLVAEESVEIACRNCGRMATIRPCATFETGPFEDGELDDPELDARLDLSVAHPIPPVPLGSAAPAETVTLAPVTVAQAAPLHRALRRRRLVVDEPVVRAMGIEALGAERDPRRIAAALSCCSDEAWQAVTDLFLQAHYSLRMGAVVLCPGCGARNDVDAPFDREFEPASPSGQSNEEIFPDFEAFAAASQQAFESLVPDRGAPVRLAVEEGVAACDDGGEPLLGAYLPPAGDPTAPVGTAEITLYYRTFRAIHEEEGPYDWRAEIHETVEHELEHHTGWLVGHDPMDDEERVEIAREHARIVGTRVAARRQVTGLASDVRGFLARTWLIWLIVALATVAITVCGR